jgi:predicted nucleic-acid-binding protein
MAIVDANIVLRYLLNDHSQLSAKAAEILEQQDVELPIEAACEVVYVLQKVYEVPRQDIAQSLCEIINEKIITIDKKEVFIKGLEFYATTKLDFVDSLLWAYNAVEQKEILTFDKKLNKFLQ